MITGNERKSPSPSPDCDVGLGLKMQKLHPTESYLCDVGGGGPLFSYSSSRVSDCAPAHFNRTSDNTTTLFLPGIFQNSPFGASAGGINMSGKALFTDSQWRELERQNTIHRYILASIPVPPHLLPGSDLRYGSSDPEPWRCKRTDGKKWRCSRDVAPDLKYCYRHAHKTKPRSRKHVEISLSSSSSASPSPSLPIARPPPPSYDQTRSIEWFVRGGNSKQQQQQQLMMQTPSLRTEPDRDDNRNQSSYYDNNERRGFYVPDTSTLQQMDSSLQTATTRHFFIDAWEKDDMGISSKIKKLSPSSSSSLSLSMSGNWNHDSSGCGLSYDEDDHRIFSGIGMMMNSSSWISPPGGPLGEALCHAGRNTNTNTNCSKSSCEDGH